MHDMKGSVAIVTGASRGLGAEIACGLARRGVRLSLAARSREDLARIESKLKDRGAEVVVIPTDVTDNAAQEHLVAETLRVFGAIDLLINNAGVIKPSVYAETPLEEVERQIAVNLTAPMMLARRVLPLMLARDRGHIVNVSSLGGLLGPGWGEPYVATKHGLVGFTRSLRASLKDSGAGVSASVICPGYIEDVGMYSDNVREHGCQAPMTLGTSPPAEVVRAVMRAIDEDLPEIVVSGRPVRLLCAVSAISPRAGEWLLRKMGADLLFKSIADATRSKTARGNE